MKNTMYTKTINHPEYEHLEVVFEAEHEPDSPRDHFEMQEHIDFAEMGDDASWFCAIVKVQIKGTIIFGVDYLGCCSYKSFEEFMQCDYFNDMINEATQDLISDVNDTTDKINEFIEEYNKAS